MEQGVIESGGMLSGMVQSAIELFQSIPIHGYAVACGLLVALLGTQWLKKTFPLYVIMGTDRNKFIYIYVIRFTSLVLGFLPTYFIWPADDPLRVWVALIVGFGTPSIYKLVVFFAYKYFPSLEEKWSHLPNV